MEDGPVIGFFNNWISLIVLTVVFYGSLYFVVQILGTGSGKKIDNALDKIMHVITYPLNLVRSILPRRGRDAFDGFLYLLYFAGCIWLMKFSV